jgi:hydrogenase maturation protein HypF
MQNAYLVAEAIQGLENAGFTVYCHGQIPPNDGGLAVGQLYAGKFLEM